MQELLTIKSKIMMTTEKMIERYEELYAKMKSSKDVKNMQIFGEAATWLFRETAKAHPDIAESFLSHMESICWSNFLSEKEMLNISKHITNQDGSKGFHWTYDTFTKAVESLGGKTEDKPHYNSYALAAVANMVYSDHALSIAQDMGYKTAAEVPNEKMALSCYRKAVESLTDSDDGFHVRKYFKHKMYE